MEKKASLFDFSCRKTTELIEKRTIFKLSPVERVQLFLHSFVCDGCRYYGKQSKLIDQAMSKQIEIFSSSKASLRLEHSVKEKILKSLESK